MGDKFSKVKRIGVIIWGGILGILEGRAGWGALQRRRGDARETGHSIQHTGGGARWVWARVTGGVFFRVV